MIKKLKEKYELWKKVRRLNRHAALIREIGESSPELIVNFITEKATDMSVRVVMRILDQEGIAHCSMCPHRFPLRKFEGRYVCETHFARLTTKKLKEEQVTKELQVA